jgi:hypothetical protein
MLGAFRFLFGRESASSADDLRIAVILFEATLFAETPQDDDGLEFAADFLTAFHAQARLRQNLQTGRRDLDSAALAQPLFIRHLDSSGRFLSRPRNTYAVGGI